MRSLLLTVCAVALLAAACGREEPPPSPAGEAPASAPATPADESEPGEPTPEPPLAAGLDFRLPAVGGGQVVGAELAGRDLALWFWAPW